MTQKFSIARERQLSQYVKPTEFNAEELRLLDEIVYLRLEPNGNLFWTIHPEIASRWEHAEAEAKMREFVYHYPYQNWYLIEATKEDA